MSGAEAEKRDIIAMGKQRADAQAKSIIDEAKEEAATNESSDRPSDSLLLTAEQIASQLRCPQGELGKEFGRVMNLRNLSMILGALAQLDLQAGNRVLELGAGDGGLLGYLLSRAPELQYIGLDISETMVAQV